MDSRRRCLRQIGQRARTFWRGRGYIVEACFRLICARLSLVVLPLKRLMGLHSLSWSKDNLLFHEVRLATEEEQQQARAIGWAVTKTAAHLPIDARCLAQALAARAMLRRRGIASMMHIGVARPDATSLEAHAWLEAAGIGVTGYPIAPSLRVIGQLHTEGVKRR